MAPPSCCTGRNEAALWNTSAVAGFMDPTSGRAGLLFTSPGTCIAGALVRGKTLTWIERVLGIAPVLTCCTLGITLAEVLIGELILVTIGCTVVIVVCIIVM